MPLDREPIPSEDIIHVDMRINHMRILALDTNQQQAEQCWEEVDRLLDRRNAIAEGVADTLSHELREPHQGEEESF